jgi:hypothetical protein
MFRANRTGTVFMVALVPLLAATLTMGARQDKPAEQSSAAAAARPGAVEMEQLKFYVGEWDYTERRIRRVARTRACTRASCGRVEIR